MERPGIWIRSVDAGIVGASEALFPENDLGAPDWREVEMLPRTRRWLAALPAKQRLLVELLFVAVEWSAPLLGPAPGRFSKIAPARREAIVRRWRASRIYPLKLLGDALKATTSMIYLSHPAALKYIGMYKPCENPGDPLQVEIRADALGAVAS
jgi:hypothetical protein